MESTASHAGTFPSSRRRYTRYTMAATASTTMAMSSWVMPLVKCPKPLKMRSKCSRWKNTAMPPAASSTAAVIQQDSWALGASPRRASTAWVPNTPADQATRVVNRIKGHCSSIIKILSPRFPRKIGRRAGRPGRQDALPKRCYSPPCQVSRRRMYTKLGLLPTSGRWWISASV